MAHLAADITARDRVLATTIDLNQSPSLDRNVQCAQIRAIEGTCCVAGFQSGGLIYRIFPGLAAHSIATIRCDQRF